jgi:predicted nucleic acid-binding protein
MQVRVPRLLSRSSFMAARGKGIEVAGTLGVLSRAAQRHLLNLADAFERVKRTNFRFRQEILDKFLNEISGQA